MTRMVTQTLTRKVVGSTLAAVLSVFLIWQAEATSGIDIPEVVEAAILTILVFVTGYYTPPSHLNRLEGSL